MTYPRNFDLGSVRRILEHCNGDGTKLAEFDPQSLIWMIGQLVRAIDQANEEIGTA
jgi:hypothetical protein